MEKLKIMSYMKLITRWLRFFFNPTDKLGGLKTQLNKCFVHFRENQTMFHAFVHVSCIHLENDNNKWTIVYHPEKLKDDGDVVSMFF